MHGLFGPRPVDMIHSDMSEDIQTTSNKPGWPYALIGMGALLMALSGAGLIMLRRVPETGDAPLTAAQEATSSSMRSLVSESVATDSPTTSPYPSGQPSATLHIQGVPTNTDTVVEPAPTDVPLDPTATFVPLPTSTSPPINWTIEEMNALTWMCYYEVGGMGSAKYDGCLSTISTVRARYAYSNSFGETDVISTLLRPNQFNIDIDTQTPAPDPDLMTYVQQYAAGARGSCNGYLYFDSVPGGPSLCVIYGAAGQFIEFHNGWN